MVGDPQKYTSGRTLSVVMKPMAMCITGEDSVAERKQKRRGGSMRSARFSSSPKIGRFEWMQTTHLDARYCCKRGTAFCVAFLALMLLGTLAWGIPARAAGSFRGLLCVRRWSSVQVEPKIGRIQFVFQASEIERVVHVQFAPISKSVSGLMRDGSFVQYIANRHNDLGVHVRVRAAPGCVYLVDALSETTT